MLNFDKEILEEGVPIQNILNILKNKDFLEEGVPNTSSNY